MLESDGVEMRRAGSCRGVPSGVEVEARGRVEGGRRFHVTRGSRAWRVDVLHGGEQQVVAYWRDGELASVVEPDWLPALAEHVRGD